MLETIRTMQAAILVQQHQELVLDEVALPKTLETGQVLVEIHYSGICGVQLGEIDGVKGPDRFLPHLLGHEGGAIVLETGPGVTQVKPSDHVVMHWRPGRGIQSQTPIYTWRGRPLNAGWVTTFNRYAVVSENRLTPISKDFDLGLAALFGCAVTTGLGVVNNDAQLKLGQSLVIVGAGGVGLNVVQGAALAGGYPIVAVDHFDHKLELAATFGATHRINSAREEPHLAITRLVGDAGADVVVDTTGNVEAIQMAYQLTHSEGRTILVGVPRQDDNVSIHTLPLHFGKVLTGSHGGQSRPERDIPRYIRLFEAGKLQLSELVTDRFPLAQINAAINKMRRGEVAGPAAC